MNIRTSFLALALMFPLTLSAQMQTLSTEHQAFMKKLDFLTGKWEGSGWMMGQDGKKHTFQQTEDIRLELEGVILRIEGIGMSDGTKAHHAYAIVSADLANGSYDFQSYLFSGRTGKFKGKLEGDNSFVWEIPNPNAPIRYTITVTEGKQWKEVGEMKRGEEWFQFFEMNLSKI